MIKRNQKSKFIAIILAITMLLMLWSGMALAEDPDTASVWNYRSPQPYPSLIEDINYIEGKYMAVGYDGALITSTDGTNWQKVDVGTDIDRIGGIAYGGGKYVLVGHINYFAARIFTSDDGVNWRETAGVSGELYDVAYGNGKFVAVGQSGKILISTDGENWETKPVTYPNKQETTLLSITYSETLSKFVAAGMGSDTAQHEGGIMTSADGENWTVTYSNSFYTIWDVTYGNGTFAAVGAKDTGAYFIATSDDGDNWIQRSTSWSAYARLFSVEFDGDKFIAVGATQTGSSAFTTTSTNGVSWSDKPVADLPGFRAVASNGLNLVAMAGYGNIYTSDDDGNSWAYKTLGTTKELKDVAWNGSDLYAAVGVAGTIQTSSDGITWTLQTSGTTNDLNKVDYLGGQFIAAGKNGTILTSANGIEWTSRTSGTTRELKGIAYGDSQYVAVGGDSSSNPVALTSADGVLWNSTSFDLISRSFVAVACGDGVFLALMQYGQVYRFSDDPDTGELISARVSDLPGSGNYPTDIIYAGGEFVAVGGYGKIYRSSDKGENWTVVNSKPDSYSYGVAYAGGNLAAVGALGRIIASSDGGTTWYLQPSGLKLNHYTSDNYIRLNGITAGDDCFVAVGENGLVLQSDGFTVSNDSDAHDVAIAQTALGINTSSGPGNVVSNLNLTNEGLNETNISWSSSKPQYAANDGKVTRPAFSDGDQVVFLTATVSKGSAFATKEFAVVVIAQPSSDAGDVDGAYTALSFDTIKGSNIAENNIVSNLTLITSGANSTTISWASSNSACIATDGTVTRPAQGESDESVTLTATISKGTATKTKTFTLTVKALVDVDAQAVADAKAALVFDTIKGSNSAANNIVSNLDLITAGANSTTISWFSSKPDYINAATGAVNRPVQGTSDETVTLTATITKGAASDTKTFTLTVKALSSGSSGSGGGGGGGSFSGTTIDSNGGTVNGDGAKAVFPKDAVKNTIKVNITRRGSSGLIIPEDYRLVSSVFDITKNKSGYFDKDVTITFSFDKSKVDEEKDELAIYWWNGSKWIILDNIEVDWSAGTISGTIGHFTMFAVLETAKAGTEPVKPAEPAVPEVPVVDLTDISGHWAEESIRNLFTAGAINGYADGSFRPNQTITRAEFAQILVKAMGVPASSHGKAFADTENHWARESIAAAYEAGIITGYGDNKFGPNDLVTREQIAAMVVRAANLTGPSAQLNFADSAAISEWAKEDVSIASANGLINGYSDNTFRPGNNATRAEAVIVIYHAVK